MAAGFYATTLVLGILVTASAASAAAAPSPTPSPSASPSPIIVAAPAAAHPRVNWLYRDREDWSALSNPALRTDPYDSLKYMPLGSDPKHYVSVGATVREMVESVTFEPPGGIPNAYLLSRIQLHADLHLGDRVRIFTQLASDFAPGKQAITPVDQDSLGLEQGFVEFRVPASVGGFNVRIGRQELAFDSQRFLAVREGPNVRQPFDAVWAAYQTGAWKVQGLYSQPVQTQIQRPFGDSSSPGNTFSGLHVEHTDATGTISAYVAQLVNDQPFYIFANGIERRNVFDVRSAGVIKGQDWDLEGMYQTGTVGGKTIRAWGAGNKYGYTWRTRHWSPRLGIQFDAASGNAVANSQVIGTFNPLFPNGQYMTLAGYPGYANLWHVKPSLTLHPSRTAQIMFAVADIWRQRVADAAYVFPNFPIPDTAGRGGSYTGTYQEARVDWFVTPHLITSLEFEHFVNAAYLNQAGMHNGNFAALAFEYGF